MGGNKWGFGEYLTVVGIGALFAEIPMSLFGGFLICMILLKWFFVYAIAVWFGIGVWKLYEVTPAWLLITTLVIFLVGSGTFLFLIGYNAHIAKAKNKERLIRQQVEYEANCIYLDEYLTKLDVHYYNNEKKKFGDWLKEHNLLSNFRNWDEAQRLQHLGEVTGKFYVCHLLYMTDEQKVAKRNLVWDRIKNNQRQEQLKKNAEQKRARLEAR
jgi:hypothetical protein